MNMRPFQSRAHRLRTFTKPPLLLLLQLLEVQVPVLLRPLTLPSPLPPPLRCDLFAPNVHTAANIANPPSPRTALGFIPPIALLIQPPKPSQLHLHFLCPQSSPKAISNLGHNSATGTFISYHLQPSRE
jgi:hypothetical protein